ncbi:MAG: L-histidine N(alpha)-methyltransferase [Rhodothermales bacterium]|nr:L-histidine N(alpha)-methyltransferase [Rhodothermales bacterium]
MAETLRTPTGVPVAAPTEEAPVADPAFRRDVLDGLAQEPRAIPCKYFYDRYGSALFDRITRLDAYYPTRTEQAIMAADGDAKAAANGPHPGQNE